MPYTLISPTNSLARELPKLAKYNLVLTNNSDVEKIKNLQKQNFEREANNKQLDKEDTQQSNLN